VEHRDITEAFAPVFERTATGLDDLSWMTPDFVWDMSTFDGGIPNMFEAAYVGPDGYRAFVATWTEAFAAWDVELVRASYVGEQVVTHARQRTRGRVSGIETEMEFGQVFTLAPGGQAQRMRMYGDPAEAARVAEAEAWL